MLVYGESGVGKTSLLQCGLANAIDRDAAEFLVIRSNVDPIDDVRRKLGDTSEERSILDLVEERASETCRTVVLVLDQFEELFLFQSDEQRARLLAEIEAMTRRRLDVRLIFCIREDFLARMTEVEEIFNEIMENRFWVRRITMQGAEAAITGPCKNAGISLDDSLPRSIVERLRDPHVDGVDLPHLQIVLDQLYDVAAARGGPLRLLRSDLDALGNLDEILSGYLQKVLATTPEPELARDALKLFVSARETRNSVVLGEAHRALAARWSKLGEAELRALFDRFVAARVLRGYDDGARYELRHDKLAEVLARWMTPVDKVREELRAIVVNRFDEFRATGSHIPDRALLAKIEPFVNELRLSKEQVAFLRRSKDAIERARRRTRWLRIALLSIAFVTLTSVTMWSLHNAGIADAKAAQAMLASQEAAKERDEANRQRDAATTARHEAEVTRVALRTAVSEGIADLTKQAVQLDSQIERAAGEAREALIRQRAQIDSMIETDVAQSVARRDREGALARELVVRRYFDGLSRCKEEIVTETLADQVGFFSKYYSRKDILATMGLRDCKLEPRALDIQSKPGMDDVLIWKMNRYPAGEKQTSCICERLTIRRSGPDMSFKIGAIVDTTGELTCDRKASCFDKGDWTDATAAYIAMVVAYNECNPERFFEGFAPVIQCSYDGARTRNDLAGRSERQKMLASCTSPTSEVKQIGNPKPLPWDGSLVPVDVAPSRRPRVAFLHCNPAGLVDNWPKLVVMEKSDGGWQLVGEGERGASPCLDRAGITADWSLCSRRAP